jgi:hypothetical protein
MQYGQRGEPDWLDRDFCRSRVSVKLDMTTGIIALVDVFEDLALPGDPGEPRPLQVKLDGGFCLPAFISAPQPGGEPPAELPAALDHPRQRDAWWQGTKAFTIGQGEVQATRGAVMNLAGGGRKCRIFLGCHISRTDAHSAGHSDSARGDAPAFPRLRRPWKCDAAAIA